MGCCNCKEDQMNLMHHYSKTKKEVSKSFQAQEVDNTFNAHNTSFELQGETKPKQKLSKTANISLDVDYNSKTKENSCITPGLTSDANIKESAKAGESTNFEEIKTKPEQISRNSISNLKSKSISSKPSINRNEKLNSYLNKVDTHNRWATNYLNGSKIVITEKDSRKEDSELSIKNVSSNTNRNNNSIHNIIIEPLLKTCDSNVSVVKNRTIGSRLSHIASERSIGGTEKGNKPYNLLKASKSPKLFKNKEREKKLEKFKFSLDKAYKLPGGSSSSSVNAFTKYKHLFGDVDNPSTGSNRNNKSVIFKRMKETADDADLSISNTNKSAKWKHPNSIFTFRREQESLRNKSKRNDILGGMDVLQLSDMNIKRFHSNDLFK